MKLETNQVVLRLTDRKEVLNALKKRHAMKEDENGIHLTLQFDGQPITFRPGIPVVVSERVGYNLMLSSRVVVGEDLTGEYLPGVVKVKSFKLGDENIDDKRTATTCPVCNKEKFTLARLARHLPSHSKDRPDLFREQQREPVDWSMKFPDSEKKPKVPQSVPQEQRTSNVNAVAESDNSDELSDEQFEAATASASDEDSDEA